MNKIILKYFDKNDELECGDCDWWGGREQLPNCSQESLTLELGWG